MLHFTSKIKNCILDNIHNLNTSDKILVAVSGGADSVALLLVLQELQYNISAAHCNFHLRGEESIRDQQFVMQLCDRLKITCHQTDFNTADYAKQKGISIEMAARELRYDYFNELATEHGYKYIAVAHHKNDNAETVLLNLTRGTGINGLIGIKYLNNNIIRPLLCVTKSEIIDYLNMKGQDFITDSSNLVADVSRNIIRLKTLPTLQEINPNAQENICNTAYNLSQATQYLNIKLNEDIQQITYTDSKNILHINIPKLRCHTCGKFLLFNLLYPKGFVPNQIDNIWQHLEGQSGAEYQSSTHSLLRNREELLLKGQDNNEEKKDYISQFKFEYLSRTDLKEIPKDSTIACLDADKLKDKLKVRHIQRGDSFIPFGMKGKQLISDYLTNHKMNRYQKREQLVFTCGTDIVWLVGQRISNIYAITPNTNNVLIIKIKSR